MVFKIKSRPIVILCYFTMLGLVIWFRFNKRQSMPTRTTQIEQVLEEMQTRKIETQHNAIGLQEDTCSIYLENAAYCLPCGHYFHVNCIKQWLKTNMSCPNCRRHPLE
ncbi:RING finger domain-containing protein [Candidatus Cardinium sp. TP]|uniref:RING finger domain-containing protein n=1 Tax=Candidatus Cardinium sp. TP TaxID=2961955 RepID=UPI0021AF72E1|nr:RING finger domain-containing protein [Candidatus Cardinium sp. TP]MCT4697022.1 hypothetical protein [Candidatus Cardinium sp. TP]MDN5246922.1 RING finger domain-containing protein [Candidatus Cardinium sp.]